MTAALIARPRVPVAVPVAIGLAWAAAITAHTTGLAHRFDHDAVAGEGAWTAASLAWFAALWTVMVAAMMLPSAMPLLRLFGQAAAHQPRHSRVLASFVGGYLAVWGVFGWVALALDGGVHGTVDALSWLAARPWLVGAAALALAGVFQFSSLKNRCLTECRHPAAYLLRHYRRGSLAAFRLGWGHGLFCVGCCWALVLVMFAAGIADLRWMAALAVLMAYEKLGRHGQTVATAAGVIAVALAALVALRPEWLPTLLESEP